MENLSKEDHLRKALKHHKKVASIVKGQAKKWKMRYLNVKTCHETTSIIVDSLSKEKEELLEDRNRVAAHNLSILNQNGKILNDMDKVLREKEELQKKNRILNSLLFFSLVLIVIEAVVLMAVSK